MKTRRNHHNWRWAIAGAVIGSLLALACWAPARWLGHLIKHASDEHIQLQQARGSVWAGSAALSLYGGERSRDQTTLPGRLHWQMRPDGLGLHLTVRADCCTPEKPLHLAYRLGWKQHRLNVQDGHSQWPASILEGLGTPWNTIRARGLISLETQGLSIVRSGKQAQLSGLAVLKLDDMQSSLSPIAPLGSYLLELQGSESTANPVLQLSTKTGPLLLAGTGHWQQGRLRFRGEASAEPEYRAALAGLLNILGQRHGDKAILAF